MGYLVVNKKDNQANSKQQKITQGVYVKMKIKKERCKEKSVKINEVGITTDMLTSRGGLILFVRYLCKIRIMSQLERLFGSMRRNRKGQAVHEIFKQLLCYYVDGTSSHLVHFDSLKGNAGYAGAIESAPHVLVSSHGIKRFFNKFSWPRIWLFRGILQKLFIWRLNLTKPEAIELGIDTMVMDNDEAEVREGVQPTYKKVKGFQPLQMTWGRYMIDAVFRGGKKHGNSGDTVEKMVRHIVGNIRKKYRPNVPIIIKLDKGFFDQKLFEVFEELEIGYISSGKLYTDIKCYVEKQKRATWKHYKNKKQVWDYIEFMDKRASWNKSRRAIYCRPWYEGVQQILDFAKSDTLLYTNLGMGQKIDELLAHVENKDLLKASKIIECAHGRGRDELVHRALKDFGHEELPFKRFAPNAAYYYTMVLAFFLFETFKEDVCADVVPVASYATTFRRIVIDIAAKIVKTAGKIILKVTSATWNTLKMDVLWEKSGAPPKIIWA